ncbi:MAG: tRNA pseudouridine(13) synthase TruD [Planctomycetota bacterium]|jgi:tRNA pseudouridine13 synthase
MGPLERHGAWLLSDDLATDFRYRCHPEDFVVEELRSNPPEGDGDFWWIRLRKRSLSTPAAESALARALDVDEGRVARAGLKDADAVTTQHVTVRDPEQDLDPNGLEGLDPRIEILEVDRCRRALRPGQSDGNRFELKLREVGADRARALRSGLERLEELGAPALFGPQRFGQRGDSVAIGSALLKGDLDEFAALACGRPNEHDAGPVLRAREYFEAGDLVGAANSFPSSYGPSARLAQALASNRGRVKNALYALKRPDLALWIGAVQASVFNRIVDRRLPELGRPLPGDVLRATGGRDRAIDDVEPWLAAATRFEVSPTGLLPGPKVPIARAAAGDVEQAAIRDVGLDLESFAGARRFRLTGARRPLRWPLSEVRTSTGSDDRGPYVAVGFDLPPGGFATVVLDELSHGRARPGVGPHQCDGSEVLE